MIQIRRYDPVIDEERLFQLWNRWFGSPKDGAGWPLTSTWLKTISLEDENNQHHLLAEEGGQPVGFVLAQVDGSTPPQGSLLALAVHPDYRRRGVGRMLHQAAIEQLKLCGVQRVQLGAGALHYFWPGVPADPSGAWAFFRAVGWPEVERSYDLVRSLDDYQTPFWVWERVRGLDIGIITADEAKIEKEIVDFVIAEMPGWARFFAQAFQENRSRDVLFAYHTPSGKILGACLVESPSERWALRFRKPVGAPGCILTDKAERGRGIGMALTARATEILQARGCHTSFIGWTWLVDWYGKLGYKIWQENIMSWMDLDELQPR